MLKVGIGFSAKNMLPSEITASTRIAVVKKKGKKRIERRAILKLGAVALGDITRLLRTVRNLKGKAYVVGGLISEGKTLRDIDIVITNIKDIPILKKALGKYAERAHFILQKKEPPATEFYNVKKRFIKVTGKEGTSPDLYNGKEPVPKNEYAGPA